MADLTGAALKGLLTPRGLIIGFRLSNLTSPPVYLTLQGLLSSGVPRPDLGCCGTEHSRSHRTEPGHPRAIKKLLQEIS
jgi:hypothetical protein